ncbi:MAG TPA: hypothetical protein VFC47_05670 [Caulobacteraceae bacterium]|nr:hypothetical protein [Caulobacteraceae bacterium]
MPTPVSKPNEPKGRGARLAGLLVAAVAAAAISGCGRRDHDHDQSQAAVAAPAAPVAAAPATIERTTVIVRDRPDHPRFDARRPDSGAQPRRDGPPPPPDRRDDHHP